MHEVHHLRKSENAHGAFAQLLDGMHTLHMDISRFRKARKLSQRDLAEMIGVDQSTVQRAESLHKSAKIATYLQYAEALNVELRDLFSEDVTPLEIDLLRTFRRIPEQKRGELFALLRLAQESDQSSEQGASDAPQQ